MKIARYILFSFLLLLTEMAGIAQSYVTTGSGSFSDPAVWSLPWVGAPVPPQGGQSVVISAGTSIAGNPAGAYNLNVQGTLVFETGYSNTSGGLTIGDGATMVIKGDLNNGSDITINGTGKLLVLGNMTQSGGTIYLNNSSSLIVSQNFTKGWNVVYANNSSTVLVAGNLTVYGNLNIAPSAKSVVLGSVIGGGCPSCVNTIATNDPAWVLYTQYTSQTPAWWEDHLVNTNGNVTSGAVCAGETMTFSVAAVVSGAGNLAASQFEWAVYGGTIAGSDHVDSVDGHTASTKSSFGVNANNKSTITVTWENAAYNNAYIAVRQTPETGCPDGKWSVYQVIINPLPTPGPIISD